MKQTIILLMSLLLTVSVYGQRHNVEGLYYRKGASNYFRLKNGFFEYGEISNKSPYSNDFDTIVLSRGRYERINDYMLKLNTEDPTERFKQLVSVRKRSVPIISKRSIYVKIIIKEHDEVKKWYRVRIFGNASSSPLDTTVIVRGNSTKIIRIPRISGEINCSLSLDYSKNKYDILDYYSYLPISTINDGYNICDITPDDDVIELNFTNKSSLSDFCKNIRLKDDYLILNDSLVWHCKEDYYQELSKRKGLTIDSDCNHSFDGIYYNDSTGGWIELKKDSFACYIPNKDTVIKHLGAYSYGSYCSINDSFLICQSLDPYCLVAINPLVQYYCVDTTDKHQNKVRFITPLDDSLCITARPFGNIKDKWISSSADTMDIYLDCSFVEIIIKWSSAALYYKVRQIYQFFPVVGVISYMDLDAFYKKKMMVIDLSRINTPSSLLMYMYLQGEIIRKDGDSLVWHGLVFKKNT